MNRLEVAHYGPRRGGVRVVREGSAYLVIWRDANGRRRYRSFPRSNDGKTSAKVWAQAFWEERTTKKVTAVTVRDLWERYAAAEFPTLRDRTKVLYKQRFRWWEDFLGRESAADLLSLEQIETFRREQSKVRVVNQVRAILTVARIVWNWGERAEILNRNPLGRYRFKFAKGEGALKPDAYQPDDFTRMIRHLSPKSAIDWRAWSLLTLIGHQGIRAKAALHLRWEDVDFEAGQITWQARFDKMGRCWTQPLRTASTDALYVALGYANGEEWVFPSARPNGSRKAVYTIQALIAVLHRLEDAAGIKHHGRRALHGLRKMVVNQVRGITNDPAVALRFVGDKDLRQADNYVRVEEEELIRVQVLLDTESANRLPIQKRANV